MLKSLMLRMRSQATVKQRPGGVVCSDMGRLLPSFRKQIELVCSDMRLAGHEPRVFETFRSPERVAYLAKTGTGSLRSMHQFGAAADIIDEVKTWHATPLFWRDLTRLSEARGLTCGSRWGRQDMPHIQAVPVDAQEHFVRVPPVARDMFCASYFIITKS